METIYDNTKKSKLTNTTKENNYYQVDYANEVTKLNVEKQQLISFLEERIKNLKAYANSFGLTIDRDIAQEIEIKRSVYKNVLDFVNKGGNK